VCMDCVCVHGCMDERECVCMDMNALANTDLLCGVPQILDRGESVCVCMEVALANTDLLCGYPRYCTEEEHQRFLVFSYCRMCSLTTECVLLLPTADTGQRKSISVSLTLSKTMATKMSRRSHQSSARAAPPRLLCVSACACACACACAPSQ